MSQRNADIFRAWITADFPLTMRALAAQYGISAPRIKQIIWHEWRIERHRTRQAARAVEIASQTLVALAAQLDAMVATMGGDEPPVPFSGAQTVVWDRLCDDLEISVRSARSLKNEGIIYIGELVQKTAPELLRVPAFGRKSLNEIEVVLAGMGLCLGANVAGWSRPL